jgi:hypothetical protein
MKFDMKTIARIFLFVSCIMVFTFDISFSDESKAQFFYFNPVNTVPRIGYLTKSLYDSLEKIVPVVLYTKGSILYTGSNGVVRQNNSMLFWDSTNTRLGLGTNAPLQRLHVVGSIQMADGNQAVGKLLVSDVNGVASWQSLPYGECSMQNNATQTTCSVTSTYFKVVGATVSGLLNNFTNAISNRLIYIGTITQTFVVYACLSIKQPNGNNQTMKAAIFKNGTIVNKTEQQFSNTSTNQIQAVALRGLISLATNDYIEVFVTNTTATNNILVSYMNLITKN